ncbi:MAG: ATPase [Ignavibacteriae bacterium HGW-Ignavibacteriae-3]|nr:MAG: ATPase [Ignavibacteriae bacterium HGW-Ignavibacteriae-3]
MKKTILIAIALFMNTVLSAQDNKVTEAKFNVDGVCGMCKSRIEKVLKIEEVKLAKWDKGAKIVKVAFLSSKITLDSLQRRIASIGHDTEKFKAPDSVYANLPKCCLYRDGQPTH